MGWSTRVDDLLAPYVEKSYKSHMEQIKRIIKKTRGRNKKNFVKKEAIRLTKRELEQGIQGLEYKLNSVASSRGDYPFTTFAIGLGDNRFEQMVSEAVLKVRMRGQGKKGKKKQVLFPKIVFLYDENLHGIGKKMEKLFNLGVECSSKAMYPDYLSMSGEGYVSRMYRQYNKVVYPMGQSAHVKPCELCA